MQKVSSGAGSSVYHVLGGTSLVMAAKEMADDDRTIRERDAAWRVRVYEDLSEVEAVRIRYLHTANQYLEAGPSFQDDVAVCLAILFGNGDPTEDEPPRMTMDCRSSAHRHWGKIPAVWRSSTSWSQHLLSANILHDVTAKPRNYSGNMKERIRGLSNKQSF